jgi:ribosomal protein S24E
MDTLEDEITRQELSINLEYFNSKQKSRQDYKEQIQNAINQKSKKVIRKVISYKLGITSD